MPPDIEKEVRNLYLSLLELLKEFWKCFPPTTPQLESEATRMHDILQRFAMVKLKPFEVRLYNPSCPRRCKIMNILIFIGPCHERTVAIGLLADAASEPAAPVGQPEVRDLAGAAAPYAQVAPLLHHNAPLAVSSPTNAPRDTAAAAAASFYRHHISMVPADAANHHIQNSMANFISPVYCL